MLAWTMRQLADGRYLSVSLLTFGRGRVMIGDDPMGWSDGW